MEESNLNEMKRMNTLMGALLAKLGADFVPPATLPIDQLVNIDVAAGIMKVSRSTVKRRMKAGLINCDKILGMRYFSRNQLMEVAHTLCAVKPKKDK